MSGCLPALRVATQSHSLQIAYPFMPDTTVEATLRRVLGDTYRLERELQAGGMSRVFMATEIALARRVVLKVLPESLATTLSADRFRREIQLLARLQHPHIVPLLAAGEAERMLWYAMPFVEGESLRQRLDRGGALPVPEVVALLRDVARALAYAHEKGVVHRDIKPDNLLLAAGSLQVADFGIARALSAASTQGGDGLQTTAGLVVGTPRYMSPEQVVADPLVDHRADLYALGAVAYELLSGRPPYEAANAVSLMRMHATAPVPTLRGTPGVSPALAALVQQLLAKEPGQRPQSAAEVLAQLEHVSGSHPAQDGHRRRWRIALGALGVVALAAFGAWRAGVFGPSSLIAEGKLKNEATVLMADIVNRTSDSLLGPTLQTALRVDLGQVVAVRMASPDRVRAALGRMTKPLNTPLTSAVARDLAEREGIAAIVEGEVAPLGSGFQLSARIVTPKGEELAAERETASSADDLIVATGRLGASLRQRLGESVSRVRAAPALSMATTASLQALREYTDAVRLVRESRNEEALAAADRAIALDSNFALGWNIRSTAFFNIGGYFSEMRASGARAFALRANLTEPERLAVEATYFSRVLRDPVRALQAYVRLGELAPDRTAPFNNAALNLMTLGRPADAVVQLRRAMQIDSMTTAPRVNLVEALYEAGDDQGADAASRDLLIRYPGRRMYPVSLLTLTTARHQFDSALVVANLLLRQSATAQERVNSHFTLASIQAVRGHLRKADGHLQAVGEESGPQAATDVQDLEWARRETRLAVGALWLRDTAGVRALLDSLVRSPEARAGAWENWRLQGLAFNYAFIGDAARARALQDEIGRAVARGGAEDSAVYANSWGRLSTEAQIEFAKGRPEAALRLIRERQRNGRPTRGLLDVGLAFEAMQQPDSALAAYTQKENARDAGSQFGDPLELAYLRWRAAEVAERLGQKRVAAAWYGKFIDLWRTADPELQPYVKEAKKRLGELVAEPQL